MRVLALAIPIETGILQNGYYLVTWSEHERPLRSLKG